MKEGLKKTVEHILASGGLESFIDLFQLVQLQEKESSQTKAAVAELIIPFLNQKSHSKFEELQLPSVKKTKNK